MNYTCKYDPTHTETYSNAIKLTQHYREAHADVYVPSSGAKRVICELCGANVSDGSKIGHARAFHGSNTSVGMFVPADQARARSEQAHPAGKRGFCKLCGLSMNYKSAGPHLRAMHGIDPGPGETYTYLSDEPTPRAPATLVAIGATETPAVAQHKTPRRRGHLDTGWNPDDIVLPVIEQLASPGNVVPVESLAALFAWRDATATMLRAISHADA